MKRQRPALTPEVLGTVERSVGERTVGRREPAGGMRIFAGVLAVSAILGGWLAVHLHRSSALLTARDARPADRAVVFIIEGVTPGDFRLAALPHVAALVKHGTSYDDAWLGQLEPDPAASAASLGTGTLPRTNGVLGRAAIDPQTGSATQALDPSQVQLGSIDQLMESHGVPSLAERIKSLNNGYRVLAVGGVGCEGPAAAGSWLADYILCATKDGQRWAPSSVAGHRPPSGPLGSVGWSVPVAHGTGIGATLEGWRVGAQDDWVARYALTAIATTHPRLTIVDFPEIGLVAPFVSADQRKRVLGKLLVGIDYGIGRIEAELRRERVLKRTVLVVTASEAATPVQDAIPRKKIDDAVQAAGAQTTYVNTDGMAMLGLTDATQALSVAQAIDGEHIANVDAIYYRSHQGQAWTYEAQYLNPELPAGYGDAGSYLLGTIASNASPDVIVTYSPRIGTVAKVGSFTRSGITTGMQWDTQHIPLILSGQGIFPGVRSAFPARLVDVAPTVEALLGIEPARGDGNVLADAMYSPPGDASDRQNQAADHYTRIVQALKERTAQAGS
jgi:hypothetical protein